MEAIRAAAAAGAAEAMSAAAGGTAAAVGNLAPAAGAAAPRRQKKERRPQTEEELQQAFLDQAKAKRFRERAAQKRIIREQQEDIRNTEALRVGEMEEQKILNERTARWQEQQRIEEKKIWLNKEDPTAVICQRLHPSCAGVAMRIPEEFLGHYPKQAHPVFHGYKFRHTTTPKELQKQKHVPHPLARGGEVFVHVTHVRKLKVPKKLDPGPMQCHARVKFGTKSEETRSVTNPDPKGPRDKMDMPFPNQWATWNIEPHRHHHPSSMTVYVYVNGEKRLGEGDVEWGKCLWPMGADVMGASPEVAEHKQMLQEDGAKCTVKIYDRHGKLTGYVDLHIKYHENLRSSNKPLPMKQVDSRTLSAAVCNSLDA